MLQELTNDIASLNAQLHEVSTDSDEWQRLSMYRRARLQEYLNLEPVFRRMLQRDPDSVICVMDHGAAAG